MNAIAEITPHLRVGSKASWDYCFAFIPNTSRRLARARDRGVGSRLKERDWPY